MKARITINSPHLHRIFCPMQKKSSLTVSSLYCHSYSHWHVTTTYRACCRMRGNMTFVRKRDAIITKTTTHLIPKTGNEVDFWLLVIGAVHFGLIRQWSRWGTSILPDMKYGGNIFCLLSEDPDSLMIQQVMSDKHTHSHRHKHGIWDTPSTSLLLLSNTKHRATIMALFLSLNKENF